MVRNKEFERLFSEVQQLRRRYLNTIASHTIFNQFNRLITSNVVGKRKAEKNAKTFSNYRYFFGITKEATRCYFLIELAKFFDSPKPRNETRTVHWVLEYAEKNIHRLTEKDFKIYHARRQIIPEILASYKQLKLADLKRFQKKLAGSEHIIKRLKIYRDQNLAHDDIKKITVNFTVREMKALLIIVKDIIELFYNKLEFASNSYRNFEKEPIAEINRLVESLAEHEKQRLEEIQTKYKGGTLL